MRTLFIDFDGTICHDKFWRSLDTNSYAKVQDSLFSGKNQIVRDWMRGVYSSEEVNQMVAEDTGIEYKSLWDVFIKDCQTQCESIPKYSSG